MLKIRTFIILIFIYVISFISIKYDINIFYPYQLIKNYVLIPVMALGTDKSIILSNDYKDALISELRDDINELKELNNIKTVLSNYHSINATVIVRNRNYWFNIITIDKGKSDGIKENMAVVSSNGLIGKISKVYNNMSEVKLITTSDLTDKTSVLIKSENNIYGIIENYHDNYLEVVITSKNNNIKEGDKVVTTGMGGIYPSGILIGDVYGKKKNKYDIGETILVKPISDFNKIKFVSVLERD